MDDASTTEKAAEALEPSDSQFRSLIVSSLNSPVVVAGAVVVVLFNQRLRVGVGAGRLTMPGRSDRSAASKHHLMI